MDLTAPIYPPAAAFETPAPVPYKDINAELFSIIELRRSEAAWAIILKHAPAITFVVDAPALKGLVSNMTVSSFISYGVISQDAVNAIDQELRRLPPGEWPSL